MPVYKLEKCSKVRFLSRHKALSQVAGDIAAGLPSEMNFSKNFTVFVGIHKGIGLVLPSHRINLGIQTEQFFDENGKQLWGIKKKTVRKIRWALRCCDYVLDLSEANKDFYEQEGLLKKYPDKFLFGPRIFPDAEIEFSDFSNSRSVFYGTSGDRRKQLIAGLPLDSIEILDEGTFGVALAQRIQASRAVLNIHFADGVYTEVPRVLSAYLSGKVLVSEKLAPPFQGGVHYLKLDNLDKLGSEKAVYDRLSVFVTQHLSFYQLLKELA